MHQRKEWLESKIKRYFEENWILGGIGYGSYKQGKTTIKKYKYNRKRDRYVCSKIGAILLYTGRIDRNGYKYYLNKKNCKGYSEIKKCCKVQGYRVIRIHIKEKWNERARQRRLSDRGKELYR